MSRFVWIVIVIALCFCGCRAVKNEELVPEVAKIIAEDDVELVDEYYHHLQEMTITYPNGDIIQERYVYPAAENEFLKDYIGCQYYKNGNLVSADSYIRDSRDNITSISNDSGVTAYSLSYDEKERVVKKEITKDGKFHGYETYVYDENDMLSEITIYGAQGIEEKTVTEFDETGRRKIITSYDSSNAVVFRLVCEFDAKKYKEKVLQYNGDNVLLGYLINTYDVYYNVIVEEAYAPDDILISTTQWKYLTGKVTYDPDRGYPGRN